MTISRQRTVASPAVLLGLFMADFVLVVWLLLGRGPSATPLLLAGVVGLAALGLLLYNRFSNNVRETSDALDQCERYLDGVADLSQNIQIIIDADHRSFVYVNPALEKVLGYKPEEFVRGGFDFFFSIIHPDDQTHVRRELDRMLNGGISPPSRNEEEFVQEEIFRIRNKWEDYRWVRNRRAVFVRHEDDSPFEILSVAHDITEQRGYEIALVQAQEFESLGTIARRLAHDLNNILMGIQGYSELGLEGHGDIGALQGSLEHVREGAKRATEICSQMLAFAGRGRVRITNHQLNEILRQGLPLVEAVMPDNIDLVLDLDNDLPPANVDPDQIRYALLNLVVNAMDMLGTQDGEVTVRTSLKHLTEDGEPKVQGLVGDFVCLEVQNTGPSMSQDTLDGMSNPFFRVQHPGRGMGLLTVRGIASEHHGGLYIESIPGKGSLCALYLPLAEKGPRPDEADESTLIAPGAHVILLVDDEPTIRAILRQGFENAGYKVIEAVDGVDGFGAFVRHRSSISVVLLDLSMPRMNGDELFEEIHKVAPEVPVILMSGYSQQDVTASLAGRGLTAFLAKPCSIKIALVAVQRAIGQTAPGN